MTRIVLACALSLALSGCGTLSTIAYCVVVDSLPERKCN